MRTILGLCVATFFLAGCATTEPTTKRKHGSLYPSKYLMTPPESIVPIPSCEAEATCRKVYYKASRKQYVSLAHKTRRLQRYLRRKRGKNQ